MTNRQQSPEDAMARIAGVPRTAEEQQAEREQLEVERTEEAQRRAGVLPQQQPQRTPQPRPAPHNEHERDQREKA